MEKQIEMVGKEWDKCEALSQESKDECSDFTDRTYRNWVMFLLFTKMEDSQLKVAIFEHLKSEGYIVRKNDSIEE
jgi:histidinol-phosphate/aromatic aminotransferase/cobyric acid decarboxylase-like protein